MNPENRTPQPPSIKQPISPHLILIAAQLAVASAAIWARVGLAGGLNPVALAAWRLTIASTLLVLYLNLRRRLQNSAPESTRRSKHAPIHSEHAPIRHPERSEGYAFEPSSLSPDDIAKLLTAGLLLGLHFATWFESLRGLPVGISTLLVATTPIWTGLYLQCASVFTGSPDAPPGRFWFGLIVAFLGIFALMPSDGPTQANLSSGVMAILGSITIAAYLLIVQPIQPRLGSLRMVAWTYSFAALTMWPAAILMSPRAGLIPHTTAAWTSIIGMALIPQLIGHTAMNWSLKHFSAAIVSAATLCEPVFAAGLAWWLLGEKLDGAQISGGVLVLVGVALALSKASSRSDSNKNQMLKSHRDLSI